MPKRQELVLGFRFPGTRLVYLGDCGKRSGTRAALCLCDCGNAVVVRIGSINAGTTISCGCFRQQDAVRRATKHGQCGSPEYRAYRLMHRRCSNTADVQYPNYGGRGIKVCSRWQSFQNFVADMGERPTKDHSLDRIDVNGDYCPENCRWATEAEQQNNKRNNRRIQYGGCTQTIAEWARETGISQWTISDRLSRGWTIQEALTSPVGTWLAWDKKRDNG